ncbi:hypothetical protein CEXT_439361 [Caerostris extrusa]|uniref:Uncharacterized protein n=1 Tax=Caerostris extrusa TaxID=172846 RepID=A0AAV4TMV1_CAEEX|nr:hypothetical protein CEXT_439361 [Caerostris extrusa]
MTSMKEENQYDNRRRGLHHARKTSNKKGLHHCNPNPAPVNINTNRFSIPTNSHPEVADEGNREQFARRPRIPPFFVKTRPDCHSMLTLIRQEAPSLTAVMSRDHFFKITVQTDQEHMKLKHFLIDQGFDFKCFSLKSEKPIKKF